MMMTYDLKRIKHEMESNMFNFLDNISFNTLLIFSIVMLLLPFRPMPHVVEKLIMLKNGELREAIDILIFFII